MAEDTPTLESKLNLALQLLGEIKTKLDQPAPAPAPATVLPRSLLEPPHVPELSLADIDPATIDSKTVQLDGSTWAIQPAQHGRAGGPEQVMYGYISEHKDPALWARMVEVFSRASADGEAWLRELLAKNGPFARYRTHPRVVLSHPDPEAFQLFSMLLSSATPETRPTAAGRIKAPEGAVLPAAQAPSAEAPAPRER